MYLQIMKRVVLSFLACLSVAACVPGPVAGEVYVDVPAEKASSFATYLASVVRRHGMVPNLGSATDDKGHSVYVLDATSSSVRLRSENVPLSGHEDPNRCGVYDEPHRDPGQYFVSVSPSTQLTDLRASRELLDKIVKDLKADGYNVRTKAIICSEQSKVESSGKAREK